MTIVIIGLTSSNKNSGGEDTEEQLEADNTLMIANDNELTAMVSDANYQASVLLSQNPVDVNAIINLYNPIIEKAYEFDRTDYAVSVMIDRRYLLISNGFKREALDVMLSENYDKLSDADKYRMYDAIISLAEELGDTAAVEKYKPLREEVSASYWLDYNMTEKYRDNFEESPQSEGESEL